MAEHVAAELGVSGDAHAVAEGLGRGKARGGEEEQEGGM